MNQSPGFLDPGREAMLLAALPVRPAAFQNLLSGRPTSVAEIAAASGVSQESARRATQDVAHVGMAEFDGSTVVTMDGLTTRRTQHCITLDGVDLCTWCAYDFVGISAALGSDATRTTQCGTCGREIAVEIQGGDPGELGVRTPWVERGAERTLMGLKEQLDPAPFQEAWERGRRLTPEAAVAMARSAIGPQP